MYELEGGCPSTSWTLPKDFLYMLGTNSSKLKYVDNNLAKKIFIRTRYELFRDQGAHFTRDITVGRPCVVSH